MAKYHSILLILIILVMGTANSQMAGVSGGIGTGIIGQVVDSNGQGISAARIWIIEASGQAANTVTNATGYYELVLSPGNYTVTAELSGYSFTSSAVRVQPSAVSLAPSIIGYSTGAAPPATTVPSATTSAYTVPTAATATGPSTIPAASTVQGASTVAATYPVQATASTSGLIGSPYYSGGVGWVQGRVADQTGTGLPFVALNVDGWGSTSTTDAEGNYRLQLSPGVHIIDPVKSGYGIPPRAAFITSGQTYQLDFIAKGTVPLGRGRAWVV